MAPTTNKTTKQTDHRQTRRQANAPYYHHTRQRQQQQVVQPATVSSSSSSSSIIITDAQIVAVLGVRERFTHPFSEAIERACDALHRLADDLRLKKRSGHAAAPPSLPLLANQKALVATAAESIGEAVRLEAAYQGALLLASTTTATSEAAASMRALSTYLLGAFPAASSAAALAVVVTDAKEAEALIDQLFSARHACAGTLSLTSTTTRVVVRSEQAAYRAQWLLVCGDHDRRRPRSSSSSGDHDSDDEDDPHPYAASGTVALTTPAGSWLVHCDELSRRHPDLMLRAAASIW
jgi:hypothetical protein